MLDEGRSTDISARSDAVVALHPSLVVEAGASAHWQDERVTKRRVVDPARPPDIREDAALDSRWIGGYALARWTTAARRDLGAGARVDHWDGTGETTASPWLNAQVRVGAFDVIGGTGLFRQFPGFNAVAGLRGTPGLPARARVARGRRRRTPHSARICARRPCGSIATSATAFACPATSGTSSTGGRARRSLTPPTTPRLDGTSRGVELLLQRRSPNGLSGWASYSLGRYRQHDVVTGERFDGDFDQRHAVSLYGVYRLNDRTSVALKLRTSSNFPVRGYFQELPASPEHPVPDDQPARYGLSETRNGARLPVYQRLDLRANRTWTAAAQPAHALCRADERVREDELADRQRRDSSRRRDRRVARSARAVCAVCGILWEF